MKNKIITLMAIVALTGCLDNQASYENCNSVTGSCGQETTNDKTEGVNEKQEIVKTDTLIKTVRDTVWVENTDTLTVQEIVTDTLILRDTIVNVDTLYLKADTVITVDTLVTVDTIVNVDTLVTSDTVVVYDTIPNARSL